MQLAREPVVRLMPRHRHPLPDPRRTEPARLEREVVAAARSPVVSALLRSVDATLVVLDAHRQIVATNGPGGSARALLGLRPGEALGCANAVGAGCGASPACEACGALGAILGCQAGGRVVEGECHLQEADSGVAREFAVRASPVEVDGHAFTVVTLRDVSAERRCERLEQLFFHDLLNTVGGLRAWAWRLGRPDTDPARAARSIDALTSQLAREVVDHQALLLAERGELVPASDRVLPSEALHALEVRFAGHAAARDRRLDVEVPAADPELTTDAALLTRVLANMVHNAFEAVPPGGAVRVACQAAAGAVRFTVRNDGEIPPEVQPRIFQRSFSTKASRGRGLGTYGMKLLGERYLGGSVSFTSSAREGTTFALELPLAR